MNSTITAQRPSTTETPAKEVKAGNKVVELPMQTTLRQQQVDAAPKQSLDEETIRLRAYEIYANRGYQDGSHEADWLEAEKQLRASK